MKPTLQQSVAVKDDVLVQDLDGEMVLLNLSREEYFGLDDVGSAMWGALQASASLQEACDRLLQTYDVEPTQLQADLLSLVETLVEHDLVTLSNF